MPFNQTVRKLHLTVYHGITQISSDQEKFIWPLVYPYYNHIFIS